MRRHYSADDIMALGPCKNYPRPRVSELWAGRDALTAREIGSLDIPAQDRTWTLIRLLPDDRARSLWSCGVAEDAWMRSGSADERRPLECIVMARSYALGDAADEELDASRDAAREACGVTGFAWRDAGAAWYAAGAAGAAGSAQAAWYAAQATWYAGSAARSAGAAWCAVGADRSAWYSAQAARAAERAAWSSRSAAEAAWHAARSAQVESLVQLLEEVGDD